MQRQHICKNADEVQVKKHGNERKRKKKFLSVVVNYAKKNQHYSAFDKDMSHIKLRVDMTLAKKKLLNTDEHCL
jgi:hypothetical protein